MVARDNLENNFSELDEQVGLEGDRDRGESILDESDSEYDSDLRNNAHRNARSDSDQQLCQVRIMVIFPNSDMQFAAVNLLKGH